MPQERELQITAQQFSNWSVKRSGQKKIANFQTGTHICTKITKHSDCVLTSTFSNITQRRVTLSYLYIRQFVITCYEDLHNEFLSHAYTRDLLRTFSKLGNEHIEETEVIGQYSGTLTILEKRITLLSAAKKCS